MQKGSCKNSTNNCSSNAPTVRQPLSLRGETCHHLGQTSGADDREQRLDLMFYSHQLRLKVLERTIQRNLQRKELLQQQKQWYENCYRIMKQQQENQAELRQLEQITTTLQKASETECDRDIHFEETDFYFLKNQVSKPNLPLFFLPINYTIVSTSNKRTISNWFQTHIFSKLTSTDAKLTVGFDTEWDFFKPITNIKYFHPNFPDIIQIATETSCLIIQTMEGKLAPHSDFVALIKDTRITKVLCNYVNDMIHLENWIQKHRQQLLQNGAELYSIVNHVEHFGFIDLDIQLLGAGALCETHLSQRLEKDEHVVFSRWSRTRLERAQKRYAAIDAYLNILLHEKVKPVDPGVQRAWANKLRRAYYRKQEE